jgi:hypothetical protein
MHRNTSILQVGADNLRADQSFDLGDTYRTNAVAIAATALCGRLPLYNLQPA